MSEAPRHTGSGRQGILRSVIALILVVGASETSAGRHHVDPEAGIKAAIVYQFTKFVRWPAARDSVSGSFEVGIVGESDVIRTLGEMAEMRDVAVAGKPFRVRPVGTPEEMRECDLLFVAGVEADSVRGLLEGLGDAPILTVSDIEGFGRAGGMIELVRKRNKIRFRINPEAAERTELRISAQLMTLSLPPDD